MMLHDFSCRMSKKRWKVNRLSRLQHALVMLWHATFWNLIDAPHDAACSSKMSILALFGPVSSSLQSFYSSITYNIKITYKSSQNDNKTIQMSKYTRGKYVYNWLMSTAYDTHITIHVAFSWQVSPIHLFSNMYPYVDLISHIHDLWNVVINQPTY